MRHRRPETVDGTRETRDSRWDTGDQRQLMEHGRPETVDGTRETRDSRRDTGDQSQKTGDEGEGTRRHVSKVNEYADTRTRNIRIV